MDRHSVGRCAPAEAASGAEIKCLVFLAGGQPLLVVLRLEDRVSQPLLARHLGLPKSRLKLAPLDRLVALCGWPVGSVPPFAHRPALRTLVDAQVAQHSHVVFGDDRQHVVPAAELLRASAAAVAAVSTAGGVAGAGPPAEQPRLPLPWAEGAQAATMIGIVAQKRKIARLLVFASLVPVQPGPLPTPGTAAYLRRLWGHPGGGGGGPVEVQLILGKTLERRLGGDAAARLFKSLRVGDCVRVTGRPQPRPAAAPAPAAAAGDDGGAAAQEGRAAILDVVVHDITVLDPGARAAMAAAAEMGQRLQAAAGPLGGAPAGEAGSAAPPGGYYRSPVPPERVHLVGDAAGLERATAALFSQEGAAIADADTPAAAPEQDEGRPEPRGFMPAGSPPPPYSLRWRPALVVGVDAEWQPFSRGEPKTSVSILQLATSRHVFIIDLLAICGPGPGGAGPEAGLSPEQRGLSALLVRLLGDVHVVTVGYGLANDLKRLAESYPWLPCFAGGESSAAPGWPVRSHVEVGQLARAAAGAAPCGPAALGRMGLNALCAAVLGRPLDKAQQCSDWGARPLTREQAAYAAADAACLVELFCVLEARRAGLLSAEWMAQYCGRITSTADFLSAAGGVHGADGEDGEGPAERRRGGRRGVAGARAPAAGGLPRRAQVTSGGSQRTDQAACNVPLLMRFLGEPLPGGGKVAAVQLAAAAAGALDAADDAALLLLDAGPATVPHFPRGSGALEFAGDVFLLFVNLPSTKYPNDFIVDSGACEMAWWGGRGQTMAHPIMQRLLRGATGAAAADGGGSSDATEPAAPPTVLLFCRPLRGAYVNLGRLRAGAVADEGGQVRVSWRLLDFAALQGSPHFAELRRLQERPSEVERRERQSSWWPPAAE